MEKKIDKVSRIDNGQLSYCKENNNAARFYEKLGFVKTGEVTNNGEIICRITV